MPPFLIGINMAGAVSAGAYTAGVLDFLIEALDAWYAAKQAGQPVPTHDVSIEVFSGASAGGMCAAIASVMVQGEFDHIHDPEATGTSNRFYESWVNKIDILELLKAEDIRSGAPVVSLLDCGIIDEIAKYALEPGRAKPRSYISPHLTLFLTLTNVTGIPYGLDSHPDPTRKGPQEGTLYHADWLRFETVKGGKPSSEAIAHALPIDDLANPGWDLLRDAAKGTGAFPIFLAPRLIKRKKSEYDVPRWESVNPEARKDDPVPPSWPVGMPDEFMTLNVDGGVIDNDPFDLAHDYLACVNKNRGGTTALNTNPREPDKANAGVISVAPFPSTYEFNPAPQDKDRAVASALGGLASVLIAQSRFFGESLALIAGGKTSSRFLIAPSDNHLEPEATPLQCASLGAFGGFFERRFRAHDFMLGRRNCQQFLRTQFVLPKNNPMIAAGIAGKNAAQLATFETSRPLTDEEGKQGARVEAGGWYPIIPLCTEQLRKEIERPQRFQMGETRLQEVVDAIYERFRTVGPALTDLVGSPFVRGPLKAAETVMGLVGLGKPKLTAAIKEQLGQSIG
jgi:hypothetical protein